MKATTDPVTKNTKTFRLTGPPTEWDEQIAGHMRHLTGHNWRFIGALGHGGPNQQPITVILEQTQNTKAEKEQTMWEELAINIVISLLAGLAQSPGKLQSLKPRLLELQAALNAALPTTPPIDNKTRL